MKCAFLGLGVMGFPMAGHLSAAKYDISVFNRTKSRSELWISEHTGTLTHSPDEAVRQADVVFSCVGNDLDSISVGERAIKNMSPGGVYVDHTTTSAACAEQLAAYAADNGVRFVDAPVSGGEAGAVNASLSVMCGGAERDLERISPMLQTYAKRIVHIGPTGHGQLCKAANQIAIAGLLQALSEAVHFAKAAGVDTEKVFEAISGGAAQSWQMENRWKTMVNGEFDFGFAVKWMRKDLDIVFREADRAGADLPVTRIVDGFYDQVVQNGGERWDTSSLVTLLEAARGRD